MKHEEKTGDDFAFGEERILEHLFGGFTLCNSRGIIRIHKEMMNVAAWSVHQPALSQIEDTPGSERGFDDDDDGSGFGGQATCVWLKRGVFGFVWKIGYPKIPSLFIRFARKHWPFGFVFFTLRQSSMATEHPGFIDDFPITFPSIKTSIYREISPHFPISFPSFKTSIGRLIEFGDFTAWKTFETTAGRGWTPSWQTLPYHISGKLIKTIYIYIIMVYT